MEFEARIRGKELFMVILIVSMAKAMDAVYADDSAGWVF